MRVIVDDKNITELIESVSWSGDLTQISRSTQIAYIDKDSMADVTIVEGNTIGLYDEKNQMRFVGVAVNTSGSLVSEKATVVSRDVMWYTGKNKLYKVYQGTPQDVTRAICGEFNIQIGSLVQLPSPVKVVSTGDKTIYQAISEAYGAGYYIYADKEKLCVARKGEEVVAVLAVGSNIAELSFQSSIEEMINRVMIIDDKSKVIGSVQNDADFQYGMMQEVYKKEDKKDPVAEAKLRLKGKNRSCNISVPCGDWSCVSGKAAYLYLSPKEIFKVLIVSDKHTIAKGIHTMELGVEVIERYGSV